MKVMMNMLATLKPRTGVGQYIQHLSSELNNLNDLTIQEFPSPSCRSFAAKRFQQFPRGASGESAPTVRSSIQSTIKHLTKVAVATHFGRECAASGIDIYHEPNFLPMSTRCATIVTVHDLSVLQFPQWHPADRVRHHSLLLMQAMHRADHVITVSDTIRAEVVARGVSPSKVTAVCNGVSSAFVPCDELQIRELRRRYELPELYLLAVGTIEPRKNLMTLFQAYSQLPLRFQEQCPLCLVGPWGWKSDSERSFFDAHSNRGCIRH
ncbi:MAG: glycosyltransferase, partial [Gemmataceae bacterium]